MRDLKLRRATLIATALVAVVATPAWGHGDLRSTSPRDGQRVKQPPREVTITLTEAPTEQGLEASVRDGCNERIPTAVSVEESTIVLTLEGAEAPGHWMAKYRAVSSVDGHQTRGKFHFMVAGPHDCSAHEEADDVTAADDDPTIIANPNPPGDGSSLAWVWFVLAGTVVLAGLAFVVRNASR